MVANQIRYQLSLHSAINALTPPIECVYPPFNDDDGLTQRVNGWRDLGFSGMLCIHPNQVAIVNALVRPSQAQLAFAKKWLTIMHRQGLRHLPWMDRWSILQ